MTDPTPHDHFRRRRRASWRTACALAALFVALAGPGRSPAYAQTPLDGSSLEDFSPMFLGMYRKLLVIEPEIRKYSEQYGVDANLSRAVCLYESGGNADLNSGAGARGYFQVMPRTFRTLGVRSNIEAGVKYLAQMVQRFDREDRAVAAYNGGPARVARASGLPLETLQYVLGVGHYRMVLKQHDAALRQHAATLDLATVEPGEDWHGLATRLRVPEWELRLHNAFLAQRALKPGQLVAYPVTPRGAWFRASGPSIEYRTRIGDNYLNVALTLGIDPDVVRRANGLWQIQAVPPGVPLRIPLGADRTFMLHAILGLTPPGAPANWRIGGTGLAPVPAPAADAPAAAPAPRFIVHRVTRGQTLGGLARRYGTTIAAIQAANGMGRRTTVRIGQRLRIPR
ncbi:MAG: transglycosylase SLT domain-containing protein [Vicinamibacterales bacterium]